MFKTVLIPVDVSVPEETQRLFHAAAQLTKGWDSTLHVVTVVPNVGMAIVGSYFDEDFEKKGHKIASEHLAEAVSAAGLTAQQHVLVGPVYDGVLKLAQDLNADLILIGAHQPALRDYLLGSNAARVVRHSNQSVLVLRD